MAEWMIYYKGGGRITSEQMGPFDVPGLLDGRGVLSIVQWDQGQHKRQMCHGTGVYVVNWYWWDDAAQWWIGGDDVGLTLYLASPGPKKVLPGETAPSEEWRRMMKQALTDHLDGDGETIET